MVGGVPRVVGTGERSQAPSRGCARMWPVAGASQHLLPNNAHMRLYLYEQLAIF